MTTWTKEEQAAHRKLWVEELRSGRHRQGQKVLRQIDGSMCCLGVACIVSGLTDGWHDDHDGGLCPVIEGIRKSKFYAPSEVRSWLGLTDDAGGFYVNGDRRALADLNDGGSTFAEIADVIESEPEGLVE